MEEIGQRPTERQAQPIPLTYESLEQLTATVRVGPQYRATPFDPEFRIVLATRDRPSDKSAYRWGSVTR